MVLMDRVQLALAAITLLSPADLLLCNEAPEMAIPQNPHYRVLSS